MKKGRYWFANILEMLLFKANRQTWSLICWWVDATLPKNNVKQSVLLCFYIKKLLHFIPLLSCTSSVAPIAFFPFWMCPKSCSNGIPLTFQHSGALIFHLGQLTVWGHCYQLWIDKSETRFKRKHWVSKLSARMIDIYDNAFKRHYISTLNLTLR